MRGLSSDDRLLASLQAPPDLRDGVESLGYWRARERRLPWYRVSARREARLMIERWERRVTEALVWQRRVPMRARFSAALLVAGTRVHRLPIKRFAFAAAITASLVLVVPLLALALLLAQIF